MLSNDYFLRIAQWYVAQGGEAAMGENETVLTPLPMFHMNALGCTVVGMILTRRHRGAARSFPRAALVAHRQGLRARP